MLYEMLRATASRLPDACALVAADGVHTTFAELLRSVDAFSVELSAAAVRKGDRIVLLAPNAPSFIVSVFAVTRLGAVVVPLNPLLPEHELRYYFTDCAPVAAITTAAHADACHRIARALKPPCRVLVQVPAGPVRAESAGEQRDGFTTAALCQYSSGSSGVPKRITRTHANLIAEADHFFVTVGLQPSDCILTVVPLFHAHGFGNCLLAAVRAGATMVLLESFNRSRVIEALTDARVTVFPGVPFMFGILASSTSIPPQRLTNLRLAFSAGAPLPRDVFAGFAAKYGTDVRQLYGSTEAGSVAINLGPCAGDLWASVGPPMRDVEVRVVDHAGHPVRPEQPGEISIRSAAMACAYEGEDTVVSQAFRDGFYWPGDLGYLDTRGNLFLTGRTSLFIDTGGHKVDPREVELVLNRHPKVAASVVVGVKGRFGRQIVKAVIVAREACTADEIVFWCHDKLADFKIPRVVEFRREIPKSPLGKVLRKYLQDTI